AHRRMFRYIFFQRNYIKQAHVTLGASSPKRIIFIDSGTQPPFAKTRCCEYLYNHRKHYGHFPMPITGET
ncbi:hypothetical protein, partial [Bifidobacterium longum]|uniref:hypothetical protein n=1 Tax=Bifidobacterium longum TaxID=216816 RepID=UPI003EC102DC